jgi:hypothetical protein
MRFHPGNSLLRAFLLVVAALSLAAPAIAAEPTILKASGPIVALDEEWIGVKGAAGPLRCRIPDRLVEKAETFAVGDQVAVVCSKRGTRSPELQAIARAKAEENERAQTIVGKVRALTDAAIAVTDGEHTLKCDIPAAKAGAVEGIEVGDRVKLLCKGGSLVQIGKVTAPVVQTVDIAGLVTAASASSITVTTKDKSRSLTCSVPARLAETVQGLAVGDAVKLLCKRSGGTAELSAIARLAAPEKPVEQPKREWSIAGAISSLSGDRVVVTGDGRSLSCAIPAGMRERLATFAVGARVKLLCRGTELGSAAVAAIARL